MNKRWIAVVLLLGLLSGCAGGKEETAPSEALYETKPGDDPGLSFCDNPETAGAVRAISLDIPEIHGFCLMGADMLTFSGYPDTVLTLWDGHDLTAKAQTVLPVPFTSEGPDIAAGADGITYINGVSREVVFLNSMLEETGKTPLPEDCTSAGLSSDGQVLYYCTATALRALSLHSGEDRPVREMSFPQQEISGVHCDGSVLQCRVIYSDGNSHTLFVSGENGGLLYESAEDVPLWTRGDLYFSIHMDGAYRELLSGSADFGPSVLVTDPEPEAVFPILERRLAVLYTQSSGSRTGLDVYHLENGTHIAHTVLPQQYDVLEIQPDPQSDALWLLCRYSDTDSAVLLHWDLYQSDLHDPRCYLQSRRTAENPDLEGLAGCCEAAEALGRKHGVQILLRTDGADLDIQNYNITPEYQVPLISGMLQQLDTALSCYPEGFLKELAGPTESGKLNICPVRSIDQADCSPTDKKALLHWDSTGNVYLLLTPEHTFTDQVHLLLSDLIASRILGVSDAFDGWDRSAPDNSGHSERVQILAAAIQGDQASAFSSGFMQSQLRQLCLGIREAFPSAEAADTLPWEKHLKS